jgi:subtilisin family serine protease
MGSYNFGNTKHGPVIINDDPPFNAASARHRYANNPYYVTPNSFSFLKRFANVTMPNSASYDGEGVDIIIMDTGVDATHPEFFDTNGNSRVVQIDWYSHMSSAIQSRYQPSINDLTSFGIDYYTSTHREHGTLVASAAAGIKHGYAKGAKIIDCPVRLGTGQYEGQKYIDLGAGRRKFVLPSISDATNAIVNWKNSRTGSDANRPVIVNMSFGFETLLRLKELESITYRGTTTNRSGTGNSRFGTWQIQDLINAGFYNAAMQRPRFDYSNNRFMYEIQNEFESPNGVLTVDSLDADINSLTNLGIHITIAAGNSSRYRVPPGHADYDNYVTLTYGKKHYWCRGDNNRTDAILCGASKALPAYNLSTFPSSVSPTWTRASDGEDFRSGYSGFGPGIDLYAVADRNWQALPVNLKVSDPGGGIRHYKTYDGNTDTNHQ